MDTWEPDEWEPDEQYGGLAARTTWPVREGQAIDIYFNKPESRDVGNWKAGFYRGIVDKASEPTKRTKVQSIEVDFPGDRSDTLIRLTKEALLPPSSIRTTRPSSPPKGADAVAMAVDPDTIASTDVDTAFGLTADQRKQIDALYYEDGHFVGASKLWNLLGAKAEATPNAKPWFDVKNRQLRKYLAAQEVNQLFRIPKNPRDYTPFDLPSEPLRNLQMDSLLFGEYSGLGASKQGMVQVIVDPGTRYVWTKIRGGKSVSAAETANGLADMLDELRSGPLKYSAGNKNNVFDADGKLIHKLSIATDSGSEFKPKGGTFAGVVHARTMVGGADLKHEPFAERESMIQTKYNLASAPTQAAFVERVNGSIRQHVRQALHAEAGNIKHAAARKYLKEKGWKPLLGKATRAINNEKSASTGLTPNQAMRDYLNPPTPQSRNLTPAQQARLDKKTEDEKRKAEAKLIAEQSKQLKIGTPVRLVAMNIQKAELRGKLKFHPRWSETIFRIKSVNRRGGKSSNLSYTYKLEQTTGEEMPGTYHREQLQAVPEMETEYLPNSTQKGLAAKLEKEKIIPPFRTRGDRNGSSWAEKTVADLSDKETGGEQRDILMWRLVAYLRQGNSKEQALRRLKDSVSETKVADAANLAILQKSA
eukprot:COSAG02_NODE_115_length_35467_cov_292.837056_9_plen_647_part_00